MAHPSHALLLAALTLLLAGPAAPQAPAQRDEADAPGAPAACTRYRAELKAQATNRAAPEESTRTTLRAELLPGDGALALLRVELPWVNKNNDFVSDPGNAGVGDLALKGTVRVAPVGGVALSPYLELKLPTAQTAALGSGKVVAVPGLVARQALPWSSGGRPMAAGVELFADVSVAGDPDRADVGYAALELKLIAPTSARTGLELAVKPVFDWEKGGQTAGVAELTGEWVPGAWRLALKIGRRLWGEAVGGTSDDKLELALRRTW